MAEQQERKKTPREIALLEKSRSLQGLFSSDGMKSRIKMALPAHMSADRMTRIAISACANNPMLYDCTRDSLAMALVRSAEFGLECDGVEGALVPFKKKGVLKAQFIPMFQGLCKLAYQSELVLSIQADVVYEEDDFKFKRGTQAFLDHFPYDGDGERGEMTYAYAVAEIKGGGWPFVVLSRAEVMRHRDASPAKGSDFSPWNDPGSEPAMWKKTAIRELSKFIPRSATLKAAIQHEDAIELDGDVVDGVIVTGGEGDEGGDDAGSKKQSTSENLAERLATKAGVDPVTAIRAEFIAAQTEQQARAVYDRYCGPESSLDEALMRKAAEIWEMRVAELRAAAGSKEGGLFQGQ